MLANSLEDILLKYFNRSITFSDIGIFQYLSDKNNPNELKVKCTDKLHTNKNNLFNFMSM